MTVRPLVWWLIAGFLAVAVLPLAGLAWFHLQTLERTLTDSALQTITAVTNKKIDEINRYVDERLTDVRIQAEQPELQRALPLLAAAFAEGGVDAASRAAVPYRESLDALMDGGAYHDLLMIDASGNVVYSVRGEADLGTNLLAGAWRATPLASGFRQAMGFLESDLTRFAPYAPSGGRVAAFVVAPVLARGRPVGAIALQINLDTLLPQVTDRTGLGARGYTALVEGGGDQMHDVVPPPTDDGGPASWVHADAVRDALAGRPGRGVVRHPDGQRSVASWSYLPALRWGMVVAMDGTEVFAPLAAARRVSAGSLAAFLLLSAALALALGRRLVTSDARLSAQEARYRAVFGGIRDGVVLYRPQPDGQELTVVDLNPAAERILRVTRATARGRPSRQAFPQIEAVGIFDALMAAHRDGAASTVRLDRYGDEHPDIWVENEIIPLPGGDIMSIIRDMTPHKRAKAALEHSLEQLNEAQRLARVGSWTLDLRTQRLEWSDEIFRIFEIDPARFGASYDAFLAAIHPDDRERVDQAFRESVARHRPYAITHRLLMPDGRVKHVHERGETLYASDGAPCLTRGTVQDITELRRAQDALQLYANIFEHSGEAILVMDAEGRTVAVNPAFTRLTGYASADVLGTAARLLTPEHVGADTHRLMQESLAASGFWQGELAVRHRDGSIYPAWAAVSAIRDERGHLTHHIAGFTDISERKAAEQRIEHLAHHDSLTGLFNRYNLEIRLSQALLSARRDARGLAVMFIDLDRFKVINDTLGHHVGDLLLVEVAHRLRACVRESDIVARLGGDEFVVALTDLRDVADASGVAGKILHHLGEPYRLGGTRLHSTPSIGISVFPQDGEDAATLMKHADAAMYHAKAQGRNNLQYFTAALNAAAEERLALERDLREAIEAGQLEVHYQPQVAADAAPGAPPVAVEALVRWRHPGRGMVSPAQFIPVAEDAGLIEAIGHWVLEQACRHLAAWKAAGIGPRRVAVNLSAHQLRSARLVDSVAAAMARHHLQRDELELEITESVAMHNPQNAIATLHALREAGVILAIDDFGTGYSSLAYLKRLPIQVLKLDREFVRDIETDPGDAEICAATLSLAHTLGMRVVAEGVETQAQERFLRGQGCDILQGFRFGRPEPADVWARRWREADVRHPP